MRTLILFSLCSTLAFLAGSAQAAPVITTTKNATDLTNPGKAKPGDTLKNTVVITNGAAATAGGTNVQYNDSPDANEAFVNGTAHASPVAFDDAYTAIGNTKLYVGTTPPGGEPAVVVSSGSNLFANDTIATSPDTIVFVSNTTPAHGSVSVNADGTFTYTPNSGFTGADTFTYTIKNSADATLTGIGTVSITVSNQVWYVDNSGANGNGTSASRFNSLANVSAVSTTNDVIYVFQGSGNYTAGLSLKTGEQLTGSGDALIVGGTTLLPAGTRPTILASSGNGVTLGTNNIVHGLNIGSSSGRAISGAAVGNLVISNVIATATGGAAAMLTNGTVNVTLDSASSSSSTDNGINLNAISGTFTVNGGSISAPSGTGIAVSGGTFGGTIDVSVTKNNAGSAVDISSKTGGTMTLGGAISQNNSASTGISLTSNTGATINFTSAITLNTSANAAFTATGGGTVTATASGSTLTTTTATALNVANTTIGASGLKFQSITAGTGAGGPANGIVLNNTGGSGGLTVTGTGSTGSGGTIQKTTGSGISLTSVGGSFSLNDMNISNTGGDGITAATVNNFSCTLCNIVNPGSSASKHGLRLTELSGAAGLTNVTVTNATQNGCFIQNTSATLASLTVIGGSFVTNNNAFATAGIGMGVYAVTTGVITSATISGTTFANCFGSGLQSYAQDTATIGDITVTNCTFTKNGNTAVDFDAGTGSNPQMKFHFLNNTNITGNGGPVINVFSSSTATGGLIQGRIAGNHVGTTGVTDSGSTAGEGIRVFLQGVPGNITIVSNIVRETACSRGIGVTTLGPQSSGGANRTSDIVIIGNDVDNFSSDCPDPLADIYLGSDNQAGTSTTLRAEIHGNKIKTVAGAGTGSTDYPTFDGNAAWLYFNIQGTPSTAQLVNFGGHANANAEIAATQTSGTAGAAAGVTLIAGPINTVP